MDIAMTNLAFDKDLKEALHTKFSDVIQLMRTQCEITVSS